MDERTTRDYQTTIANISSTLGMIFLSIGLPIAAAGNADIAVPVMLFGIGLLVNAVQIRLSIR